MIRTRTEAIEAEILSPFAARASQAVLADGDASDPIRTPFQRDRDRILHSKAFRRLKHKTQVFIAPTGDHYRTRMTHTLEVAQIARTIGRALRLNEDLIEAIALGHDVGHPPFGHAGEAAIDAVLQARYGRAFRHYEHSLRVLVELEGLKLCQQVVEGIGGHSKGEKDLTDADGLAVSTLEAAVVRISDRIAYVNHDLDDAVRSGIVAAPPAEALRFGQTHGERIATMVTDVVNLSLDQPAIRLSEEMLQGMNALKNWLFENVYYRYPKLVPEIEKAKALVTELLEHFLKDGTLPEGYTGVDGAVDYVSGMTDRFAIRTFESLRVPLGFDQRLP